MYGLLYMFALRPADTVFGTKGLSKRAASACYTGISGDFLSETIDDRALEALFLKMDVLACTHSAIVQRLTRHRWPPSSPAASLPRARTLGVVGDQRGIQAQRMGSDHGVGEPMAGPALQLGAQVAIAPDGLFIEGQDFQGCRTSRAPHGCGPIGFWPPRRPVLRPRC